MTRRSLRLIGCGVARVPGSRSGPDTPRHPSATPISQTSLDRAAPETLFGDDPHPDSRPAWNAEQEAELRSSLLAIPTSATQPRDAIAALEAAHGARRNTVWAQLGRTPLTDSLGWLHLLADATDEAVPATGLPAVTHWYVERGHRIDDYAVRALAAASSAADRAAVRATLSVVYDPWLNRVAGLFQREAHHRYIGATGMPIDPGTGGSVDGLRFDLGQRLADRLVSAGLTVHRDHRLAAFPTVTPTGQPAVAPLTVPVGAGPGMAAGDDRGRSMSGQIFRDALAASGVSYLGVGENGDPTGRAWTQTNDIDALGHAHGHKLADLLDHELGLVAERVESLLTAGWRQVVVVTDHGFLLPAGPAHKVELAMHLTEGDGARKPRVARLKADQTTTYPTLPWTWANNVTMASAPEASAFVAGTIYEHGGLSPQECVIPVLTVGLGATTAQDARIEGLRWTGYRCRVDVMPATAAVTVEVRYAAGDGSTRIGAPKQPVEGEAKILVSEEAASEGREVVVVLVGADGTVLDQKSTTVVRRVMTSEVMELDALDQLAAEAFDGYIVRKDLVLRVRPAVPGARPTSASSCSAATAPAPTRRRSRKGWRSSSGRLRDRAVRAGEEELFKARAREDGSVKIIDIISARLDADRLLPGTLPSLQLKDVRIADKLVRENERMLTGGFYAEVDLDYDAVDRQEKNGRPFGDRRLRPIQLSKRDVLDAPCRGPRAVHDRGVEAVPAPQRRPGAGRA